MNRRSEPQPEAAPVTPAVLHGMDLLRLDFLPGRDCRDLVPYEEVEKIFSAHSSPSRPLPLGGADQAPTSPRSHEDVV